MIPNQAAIMILGPPEQRESPKVFRQRTRSCREMSTPFTIPRSQPKMRGAKTRSYHGSFTTFRRPQDFRAASQAGNILPIALCSYCYVNITVVLCRILFQKILGPGRGTPFRTITSLTNVNLKKLAFRRPVTLRLSSISKTSGHNSAHAPHPRQHSSPRVNHPSLGFVLFFILSRTL